MDVPLSWHTDIAVLVASGSAVEEHADHLVVRTPADPTYDWGNFVMVTDPATVDDAARWEAVFASASPRRAPGDRAAGRAHRRRGLAGTGLEIEHEDVLVRDAPLERRRWPRGTSCGRCRATTTGSSPGHCGGMSGVAWSTAATRCSSVPSPVTAGRRPGHPRLRGRVARYQDVMTEAPHRRRGLTSHLLGEASAWAAARGVHTWVILADAGEAPSRLYQKLGFRPAEPSSQAYRPAPRT